MHSFGPMEYFFRQLTLTHTHRTSVLVVEWAQGFLDCCGEKPAWMLAWLLCARRQWEPWGSPACLWPGQEHTDAAMTEAERKIRKKVTDKLKDYTIKGGYLEKKMLYSSPQCCNFFHVNLFSLRDCFYKTPKSKINSKILLQTECNSLSFN